MKCSYKIVRLQNVSDTKCSSYKMLGYEMIRLRVMVTKCPSYDMCGNPRKANYRNGLKVDEH